MTISIEYKNVDYNFKKSNIDIANITLDDLYKIYELNKLKTLIKRINDDYKLIVEEEENE